MFPTKMIEHIWNTAEGKHESTLSAIYGFFETISAQMNPTDIATLFHHIDRIEDINELTITLIQKTTENALMHDPTKYYGFPRLWSIMQDTVYAIGVREHA